jgi:[protein-PII] uridylyltransferase
MELMVAQIGDAMAGNGLKRMLAAGWEEIRVRHAGGAAGREIASALTDLCDRAIAEAYAASIEFLSVEDRRAVVVGLAVVAVGGYGRRDLAPFSDVDLLFLHAPAAPPIVGEFISALSRGLWDIGLKPSTSVRTAEQAVAFAREDLKHLTALTEARLLIGSSVLFEELGRLVDGLISSVPVTRFLDEVLAERAREHQGYYAESVCLLEPSIKKSPGGLRDLHLIRWLARLCHGTLDSAALCRKGALSAGDADALAGAAEFLQKLRNELHFHAGMSQDVLTREEQVRLAAWLGFESRGALLGVERFMQAYYRQTTCVHDIAMRFIDQASETRRRRSVLSLSRLAMRRVEGHFLVSRGRIAIAPGEADAIAGDARGLLELFELARRHNVRVAHETLERVRAASPGCAATATARDYFLRMLANPVRLGDVLRGLHRVGVLSRLLPAFEHARCLIQFNLMHKYTVDEHTIRAVEAAARRADDPGPLGQAYREIHRKDILHLALLLHDLGKGLGDDHCEVGRRIAEAAAGQFGLDEHERHLLVFLVRRHLLMAHTAYRRDVTDLRALVQFARTVATPEILRMLYVLTAADTEAVAPGEFTAWKASLLNDLYFLAAEELTGEAPVADEEDRARAIRQGLLEVLQVSFAAEWLQTQLEAMPLGYLLSTDAERIAAHLQVLHGLVPGGVRVASEYDAAMGQSVYTIFTYDDLTPGLFSKIAGVLAASGFQVASARIVTRTDRVVVDTFRGLDVDFSGEPPMDRRLEIAERIEDVLLGRRAVESLFTQRRAPLGRSGGAIPSEPPKVEIDNDSSDRYTIVEVFAGDRLGLLYAIARVLFECGLSVHSAKISTHYDQIVDAFYVTAAGGEKVTDPGRSEAIRRRLMEAI